MTTVRDVAKLAGVSAATVSRYLNGHIKVAPETEERIRDAVAQLDYRPNRLARSLAYRRSEAVAVIVPDMVTPFFAAVAKGVEMAADQAGYTTILCDSGEDPRREQHYLRKLELGQVDGCIVAGDLRQQRGADPEMLLGHLVSGRVPTVLINRKAHGYSLPQVRHDSRAAARLVTSHLLSLGHRRVGLITGPESVTGTVDAVEGFFNAIRDGGLHDTLGTVEVGDLKLEGGGRAAEALLLRDPGITGLVAFSELMAAGAIKYLRETERHIPSDISVVGIGDTYLSQVIYPALTTAAFDMEETGVRAFALLMQAIDGQPVDQLQHDLEPVLRVRASTGPPGRTV